mgnify:CR=1 FL=1
MIGFVLRAVIAAFGLWLASRWIGGLQIDSATTLLLAGLLLGIVNAVIRPIAIVLTFPITLVTLGIFLLIVNAGMLALVAAILPGFTIGSFGAAFLGALLVSVVSWVGSSFIGSSGIERLRRRRD